MLIIYMIFNTTHLGNHSNMMSRLYPRRRPQATTREGSYHDVEHMVSSPVEVGGIERVWAGTQPTLGLNEREIY